MRVRSTWTRRATSNPPGSENAPQDRGEYELPTPDYFGEIPFPRPTWKDPGEGYTPMGLPEMRDDARTGQDLSGSNDHRRERTAKAYAFRRSLEATRIAEALVPPTVVASGEPYEEVLYHVASNISRLSDDALMTVSTVLRTYRPDDWKRAIATDGEGGEEKPKDGEGGEEKPKDGEGGEEKPKEGKNAADSAESGDGKNAADSCDEGGEEKPKEGKNAADSGGTPRQASAAQPGISQDPLSTFPADQATSSIDQQIAEQFRDLDPMGLGSEEPRKFSASQGDISALFASQQLSDAISAAELQGRPVSLQPVPTPPGSHPSEDGGVQTLGGVRTASSDPDQESAVKVFETMWTRPPEVLSD